MLKEAKDIVNQLVGQLADRLESVPPIVFIAGGLLLFILWVRIFIHEKAIHFSH